MMQANESINNIYDDALANRHALNEKMKKSSEKLKKLLSKVGFKNDARDVNL